MATEWTEQQDNTSMRIGHDPKESVKNLKSQIAEGSHHGSQHNSRYNDKSDEEDALTHKSNGEENLNVVTQGSIKIKYQ